MQNPQILSIFQFLCITSIWRILSENGASFISKEVSCGKMESFYLRMTD